MLAFAPAVRYRCRRPVLRNFTLELAAVTTSVVVVGSRAEPRSVTESTVPVDVLAVKGSLRRFVP